MSPGFDSNAELGASVTLDAPERQKLTIRRAALRVIQGPGAGVVHEIADTPWVIGKDDDCDLVLAEPTVSGRHAEIGLRSHGYLLSDLDSRNGLRAGGWRVREIYLAPKMILALGGVSLEVVDLQKTVECALGPAGRLGRAIGTSLAMRRVFGLLESAARSHSAVLLEGESGTGKGVLAEALHDLVSDEERPFVVFDCGALAGNLVESELFGHEAGAFTGQTVLDYVDAAQYDATFVYERQRVLYPEGRPDTTVSLRVAHLDGFVVCRIPKPDQEAIDIEVFVEWVTADGAFDEGFHTYLRRQNKGFVDAAHTIAAAAHDGLHGAYRPECVDAGDLTFEAEFSAEGAVQGSVHKTCETDISLPVGEFSLVSPGR